MDATSYNNMKIKKYNMNHPKHGYAVIIDNHKLIGKLLSSNTIHNKGTTLIDLHKLNI